MMRKTLSHLKKPHDTTVRLVSPSNSAIGKSLTIEGNESIPLQGFREGYAWS